jgi:hypothetical protein
MVNPVLNKKSSFDSLIVSFGSSLKVRRILRSGRLTRLLVFRLFVAADPDSANENGPASSPVFLAGEISIETSDAGHGQGSTAARSAACHRSHPEINKSELKMKD